MNPKYIAALTEIQHLATEAIIKGEDLAAGVAMKLIIDEITATNDGEAGVRALPGCPSLMPSKVIPHDEPAAEVPRCRTQQEYFKQHYSICDGMFPIRRGNSEECVVESCWVDKHRFTAETVVTEKVDGVNRECEFTIRDNGTIRCSGRYYGGKAIAEKIAHSVMKSYIRNLGGGGSKKYKHRGGFLKQAFDRIQEKEAANG